MNYRKIVNLSLIIVGALLMLEYHLGRLPLGYDIVRQYTAALHTAYGNGLVYPEFNPKDISQPILNPRTEFPPGLSVLLAPLFLVFDDIRIIHTSFALGNLLLFLFLTYKLLERLTHRSGVRRYGPFILFFLAVNGILVTGTASSDMININLSIIAALFLERYIINRQLLHMAIACLMPVLCVYFRYAYFPALAVIPVFFGFRILWYKQKEFKELLYSIGFTLIFAIPILGHVLHNNLKTNYISKLAGDETPRFYWENLLQANPFPMETFFPMIPILRILGFTSEYGYDRGYEYSNWLHFAFYFISLILLIPAVVYLYRIFQRRQFNEANNIIGLYGVIFSAGLISLIATGSVINPSLYEAYNWSWAKVFRYFTFPGFLLQLTYFLILIKSKDKNLRRFVWLVLIGSLCFSAALKTYNYTNNYQPFNFKKNTSIHSKNAALFNAYQLHRILPSPQEKHLVLFIDENVPQQLSWENAFFGMNNATTVVLPDTFSLRMVYEKFHTSETVDAFFITGSEQEASRFFSGNSSGKAYAELPNDLFIFRFELQPK